MNDILHELERLSRAWGGHPFFYLQDQGPSKTFSFGQVNYAASALARELAKRGATPGSTVVCRSYNAPEVVVAAISAAYGGYNLALMSPRLSVSHSETCLSQLSNVVITLEESDFMRVMLDACGHDLASIAQMGKEEIESSVARLGLDDYEAKRLDAFDAAKCGIVLFSAQDGNVPVAVNLSWERLTASARQANDQLGAGDGTVWQLILPLSGIDGFQVMVRSLMNATPFLLYTRYSGTRILNDVLPFKVTHISVVETHLADLLDHDRDAVLCQYQCILLGGEKPSHDVLRRAGRAGAHLAIAKDDSTQADLIAHGHELGLDCTYDEGYIALVSKN